MKNFLSLKHIEIPDSIENYYEIFSYNQLGEGHYGSVYKVTRKQTGTVCALKVIEKDRLNQEEEMIMR
jgi:predicted Ser/Thr protein kinase